MKTIDDLKKRKEEILSIRIIDHERKMEVIIGNIHKFAYDEIHAFFNSK